MAIRKGGFRALVLGLLATAGLALAPTAFAHGHFSIGIDLPGVSLGYWGGHRHGGGVDVGIGGYYGTPYGGYYGGYYAPAPVYYAPAPVYYDSYYYAAPRYRAQYRSRGYYRDYDRGYDHDRGYRHDGYGHDGYGHDRYGHDRYGHGYSCRSADPRYCR